MKQVCIGMAGAGFACGLHCSGYPQVSGVNVRLKTLVDVDLATAKKSAELYGFEKTSQDFNDLLTDPEIDVIDIVTPPFLHAEMIKKAVKAGKHVICEKPLMGYFGKEGDVEPVGKTVPKAKMLNTLLQEMNEIKEAIDASGKKFMYAENYVYATPIQKAVEIIRSRKSKLMYMIGEESPNGSTAKSAADWSVIGGGVLLRGGIHALSGCLWLKMVECEARGEEFKVASVSADMGQTTKSLTQEEYSYLRAHPNDVEDFASVTITFSDGTKALVISTDTYIGGLQDYIQCYFNDAAICCKMSGSDLVSAFFADERGLENIRFSDVPSPTKQGWSNLMVSNPTIKGYAVELQDFMDTVAEENRKPLSGFDLAYITMKTIYAAYVSAEEGRRISFD